MQSLGADDPRVIGGHRLLGRLGEGGMGRVYLARSERGRTVAIKVVRSELARQTDFRRRFRREIEAAARVGGEWTAPVLDADTESATPWVATGYIAGPSLAEVVGDTYGPLPERTLTALASGLVQSLRAIHSAGLVHRDLKPANILVTLDGPRVIDFGIARALDAADRSEGPLTRTGALLGSPGFMSPEQVRGLPVHAASDVFCLGTVLAYAASGRMPFGTESSGMHALLFRIAEEQPDLTGVPGRLYGLVDSCLAKDPDRRPGLDALAEQLDERIDAAWLPGEVLAQLGRHAAELLDHEEPLPGPGQGQGQGQEQEQGQGPSGDGQVPDARGAAGAAADAMAPGSAPYGEVYGGVHAQDPAPASAPAPVGAFGPPLDEPPRGTPSATNAVEAEAGDAGDAGDTGQGAGAVGNAPTAGAKSPRDLARRTYWLLIAYAVYAALSLPFHMAGTRGVSNEPGGRIGPLDFNMLNGRAGPSGAGLLLEVLGALTGVALVVAWSMWFWQVRLNAEVFAPGWNRHGKRMAVVGWFLPVGNLFLPKRVIEDIWAASRPEGPIAVPGPGSLPGNGAGSALGHTPPGGAFGPVATGGGTLPLIGVKSPLVGLWWAMWLLFLLFSTVASFIGWAGDGGYATTSVSAAFAVVENLCCVPAAVLGALVVKRITGFHETRLAAAR
ncbi:protein kinase domain-containing protein [Streptomyces daliensis]